LKRPDKQRAAIAAAELQVLAEEARAAALKSGAPDLDQVVRVQGAADRAVRRLGIKPGPPPPQPTIREVLIAEAQAREEAEAECAVGEAADADPSVPEATA
jgi:hypothetical protein